MRYIVGYTIERPFITRTMKKEYKDGKIWAIFIEKSDCDQIFLYALYPSGEAVSKCYTFRNHRYLKWQVPSVLKRAGWLSTALSTLDSIAEKYK